MRRVVDDEVPGAAVEETGPAAVRRVPPGLLDGGKFESENLLFTYKLKFPGPLF